MIKVRLACVVFLLLFAALVAFGGQAQEVHGTVTDETGAIIVGAKVTLDDGQGRKEVALSDEAGHYRFAAGGPAGYTLNVSAKGFADFSPFNGPPAGGTNSLNPAAKERIPDKSGAHTA